MGISAAPAKSDAPRNRGSLGSILGAIITSQNMTKLHTEISDFSQVLELHGLDLTKICDTNPVT